MPIAIRAKQVLNRRQLLVRSAATIAAAGLGSLAKPYLSHAADRPRIACGIQSGDVSADSAVIWGRADRPARMQVECSTVESFKTIIGTASSNALPDSDFTSKALIDGLPAGQDIFYRVRFDDIASGLAGETRVGHFRTAPAERRSVSFVWSGDAAGQGWGIDPARGGMRTYRTMRDNRPDFFIHSGDHIYADCPIPSELKLPNGEIWRNIVTEEKSVVAHSLAQFRGNYKYNWLDENFRAFHAEVPMFAQWDDHEVTNDWAPLGSYDESGFAEDGIPKLVARARRAFHEFMPMREPAGDNGRVYRRIGYGPLLDVFMLDMRSYRDNTWNKRDDNSDTFILGPAQLAWLKRELLASKATLKVIGSGGEWQSHSSADSWKSYAREEQEIFDFLAEHEMRNILLLSGDRHFTAGYHVRGRFIEVCSGPLGSPGAKSKPVPEMFAYHDDGRFFCIYDIDTAATPPAVTLEIWRTGTGLVEKRAFTWDQVTGGAKIEVKLPSSKPAQTLTP